MNKSGPSGNSGPVQGLHEDFDLEAALSGAWGVGFGEGLGSRGLRA